ncbi:MAG TPA: ABC transporter substrate-binding protein [Vicinamibacterales bacterium]|nr:ABC transporter substrate-binding protein [Vicinamibacterales bacterium]
MPHATRWGRASCGVLLLWLAACSPGPDAGAIIISGSGLGREADVLRTQIARFSQARGIRVELQPAPDSADERHQLYVQWLNARAATPDVLQIDVIWTPEFAAAGWLLPLDAFAPRVAEFFPAAIAANSWDGTLFALPWFIDTGMLYWRTDLLDAAPRSFADLTSATGAILGQSDLPYGFVWQGARYEGLMTVFVEILGGFGASILDERGRVTVDSERAVNALTFMRDAIHEHRTTPAAVLTWQEEDTRFAFQNGQAVLMRNWPYAKTLLDDPGSSKVAGRFGVARMPSTPEGRPTAALGGAQLAVNARSRRPEAAYALVAFLTAPEQMLERARVVGQFPSRPGLYDRPELSEAIGLPAAEVRDILQSARPRPVTPVYTELSGILQVHVHRALTRQTEPRAALESAAAEIRRLLARSGLDRAESIGLRKPATAGLYP